MQENISMFRKLIISERKRQGLTQSDLAEKIGVRQATISEYESEKSEMKSETLSKIIESLGIDVLPGQSVETRVPSDEEVEKKVMKIYSQPGIHQDYKGKEKDEWFAYWRKLLSAVEYKCPKCETWTGYLRKTVQGEILGCDFCLRDKIQGYYNP